MDFMSNITNSSLLSSTQDSVSKLFGSYNTILTNIADKHAPYKLNNIRLSIEQ